MLNLKLYFMCKLVRRLIMEFLELMGIGVAFIFGIALIYFSLTKDDKTLRDTINDPNGSEYDFLFLIILGIGAIARKINIKNATRIIAFIIGAAFFSVSLFLFFRILN